MHGSRMSEGVAVRPLRTCIEVAGKRSSSRLGIHNLMSYALLLCGLAGLLLVFSIEVYFR